MVKRLTLQLKHLYIGDLAFINVVLSIATMLLRVRKLPLVNGMFTMKMSLTVREMSLEREQLRKRKMLNQDL